MIQRVSNSVGHVAEIAATPVAYAASSVAVLFGLSVGEWQAVGVVGGLLIGALTLGINFYFQCKRHKAMLADIKKKSPGTRQEVEQE